MFVICYLLALIKQCVLSGLNLSVEATTHWILWKELNVSNANKMDCCFCATLKKWKFASKFFLISFAGADRQVFACTSKLNLKGYSMTFKNWNSSPNCWSSKISRKILLFKFQQKCLQSRHVTTYQQS